MPKTVLVIDDSPITRTIARVTLEQDGYRVVEAEDGEDAKSHLGGVDAVLSDVMMPRMGGLEFVTWLRSQPGTARLPVVFASVTTRDDLREAGKALGAIAWIRKPLVPDQLIETLQRVCPNPKRSA